MTVKTTLTRCYRWTGETLSHGWIICRKLAVLSRRWWRQVRAARTR